MPHSTRREFLAASAAGAFIAQPLKAATGQSAGPIRIGQIGTKHAHASGKMGTLRKYPELFEIVGVTEADADQRKRMQESSTYRGLNWITEAELLKTDGLEAIAVETHIDELLATAERCVTAGKHVHLDKPAGTSMKQFRRICKSADDQDLMIQMGYMFRSNPAFQFMFNAVRQGWLGDIFQVHCEMSKKVDNATRKELAQYRGGSMFELGCHIIDAVVTVLGTPEKISAFNRNTRPDFDNLMDTCLAVFEYPRATATVRSSVCEVAGGRRRQFLVCGTKGTIVIRPLEPFQLTLTLESAAGEYKRGTHSVDLPASPGRYDDELRHFAAVIRGDKSSVYSTKHDLAVQEAILRASEMPLDN
jgi:predicted dehydrogenase